MMRYEELARLVDTLERRLEAGALYEVFDLAPNADEAAIRNAYRGLAKKLHEDALGGADVGDLRPRMQSLMGRITQAQTRLLNPKERAEYDAELSLKASGVPTDIRAIFAGEEAFRVGRRFAERGEYPQALKHLQEAMRLNPSDDDHRAWLRWTEYCLHLQGPAPSSVYIGKVREELTALAQANQNHAAACVFLGHIFRNDERPDEALRWYRNALEREPHNQDARSGVNLLNIRRRKAKAESGSGGFFARLFRRG
jgi:tetratricopeptide (TPR) repeat protein